MKATDGLLAELARAAGVRPPHIFHLWHYKRAAGDRFSIEGYAAFAMIDAKHVTNMLAVLDTIDQPKRRTRVGKSQLAESWQMPEEWLLMGRDLRFWSMDVCRTEADKFVNWHRMKGNAFADWKAAWRNWISGSHRENGTANVTAGQFDSEDARREYLERLR